MITLSNLQHIIDKCNSLLTLTEELRRNETTNQAFDLTKQLYPSIRKLLIASMMYRKRLVCVSGLQGAGKTTLMKSFYGIGEDIMNVSLGRGERIPVLITEGKVNEPRISAVTIVKDENGNYSSKDIILNKEEIIEATKGEDPSIMYLEITVPYKHTYNDGVSFMLLPGFEKQNEYWNDLIEFSVNSSDAAIFVFNETSFSNSNNEEYLSRVEKKFGSNIVYVISHSDESNDGNLQVKNTCIEVLKIKENQSDRIVCAGQYNDAQKNDEWITSLKIALDKYALFETQASLKNSSFLFDELCEMKRTLYSILGILNDLDDDDTTDYRNHKMLQAFDEAISKKRKEIDRNLTDEFENAKKRSTDKFAVKISEKPWWKNLKTTFFGPTVREQYLDTQKMIEASLKEGNDWLPDWYQGKAIAKSIRALDNPAESKPNSFKSLVDISQVEGNAILLETENTKKAINDVCAIVRVPEKNVPCPIIENNSMRTLFKAIAEITTYYYGLTSYNQLAETIAVFESYIPAESHLKSKDILDGANSTKKFAIGLGGIMGIDILSDGSLNLINQIATSCSIALPYSVAATALIVGAGGISVVMKDINRMQRADFESAKMTINRIYDNIHQEILARFDVFSEYVRERIEDNLAALRREETIFITNYNAQVELNNLLDLLSELLIDYHPTPDVSSLI